MPMTSDEHAELLMRQNNHRLLRSSLISNLILGVILLGVAYFVFTTIIQNDSNPDAEVFLMAGVALVLVLVLNRLFFRLPRSRPWISIRTTLNTSANKSALRDKHSGNLISMNSDEHAELLMQ
jgi:hypothetical protein